MNNSGETLQQRICHSEIKSYQAPKLKKNNPLKKLEVKTQKTGGVTKEKLQVQQKMMSIQW